jgi:hypothetical protein
MKNNKLIAEFMELEASPKYNPKEYYIKEYNSGEWYLPEEMQYHNSWDWLMPVIENIDHLQNEPVMSIEKALSTRSIDDTYKSVVEFINEYNK